MPSQDIFNLIKKLNLGFVILPILIFSIGFITLLSVSPVRIQDHLVFFVIGVVGYVLAVLLDQDFYKYYWKYIYSLSVVLLVITFFAGEVKLGASRWLSIGTVGFQPSEFAKIAAIITVSTLIAKSKDSVDDIKKILKICGLILVILALILVQPDLGTSIVVLAILVGELVFAGMHKIYLVFAVLALGIFSTPVWNLLKDYQKQRIIILINPALDTLGSGYNVIQSLIAIGSGGMFGKGFGHGTQTHLQFLPIYWTDFIFASFTEEWGFLGALVLLLLYCALLAALIYTAYKVKDTFGSLVCMGVFMVLFAQFTINIGMNIGIMPVTGITLPLVSYGGSSMVVSMILLGIVQGIWVRKKQE